MAATAPSSRCHPSSLALRRPAAVAPSSSPRRGRARLLRCRCCEDTLGAPRRREQKQAQQLLPELAAAARLIREQDFGNFQDREQMRVEKLVRQRYGRFFYRFPNGESAADVYDRITGFRETLLADIDIGRFHPPPSTTPNMNIVIVSHGLTLRVFLMRWYKWTVRQFEGLNNLGNGQAVVMQTGEGGRYSLLVHHTADELREFGLTDEMLQDQMWQKTAKPGELNYNFMTNQQSFFDRFVEADY